jgi:hypothetical protein
MKKRVLVIAVRCEQSASSCSRIHHAHLCIDARSDGEALLQRELRMRTSRFRRLRNWQQVRGGGLVMGPWADLMGPWADQIDIMIYLIFRRVQQHHVPPRDTARLLQRIGILQPGRRPRAARAARLCNDCFGNVPDFPPLLPVLYR